MNALVLCNGSPPGKVLTQKLISEHDLFIAADGGGNVARNMGFQPTTVIGDLDSYEPVPGEDVEVIQETDQETNDLEKALRYLAEHRYQAVTITGATGYRLDHTLKNLSVLKQFNSQFQHLELREPDGRLFLLPPTFETTIEAHTPISLFPLSGRVEGITTRGLKYPLENEALENGVRDGSSNEAMGGPLYITYQKGDLLIYIAEGKSN